MSKLSFSLLATTWLIAGAAMFANAQPAAKPKAPPTAEAKPVESTPAAPVDPTTCPHGPCPSGAAGGGPKAGMMHGGSMMQHAMHPEHHAPFHELAEIADVKVQTTKFGAILQFAAKNSADTAKVQQHVKDLADHLAEQAGQPRTMHGAKGPMHHGGHHRHGESAHSHADKPAP